MRSPLFHAVLGRPGRGGLVPGRDAVLSGPRRRHRHGQDAAEAGFDQVIGFDMGGTSTDVSHYAGASSARRDADRGSAIEDADARGAHGRGRGGSICRFDGMRLRVGPESAGAIPGPACYGRGDL